MHICNVRDYTITRYVRDMVGYLLPRLYLVTLPLQLVCLFSYASPSSTLSSIRIGAEDWLCIRDDTSHHITIKPASPSCFFRCFWMKCLAELAVDSEPVISGLGQCVRPDPLRTNHTPRSEATVFEC